MISFKPITISDKEVITSYTYPSDYRNCDFSFANMCSWRFLYNSEYAIYEGFMLIRFWIEDDRAVYMSPVGKGDLKAAVSQLEKDSLEHGHLLCMLGVTPDAKAELEAVLPGDFRYIPERDYSDYIYLKEDLKELKGKKYSAKRNHVNRFKKEYDYVYKPITSDIINECLELEGQWFRANEEADEDDDLSNERRSLSFALHNFEELGLIGGSIWVDGQLVAFSFGSPINHNTFGVHVEKADVDYDGSFAVINQEFASHLPDKFVYVNREEDLGLPGLRKSKLSYYPYELLEKNAVVKKNE